MQVSTANDRSYIYLYLDGMIHANVFEKIAPLLENKYQSLAKILCHLFHQKKEISAENIYLVSKDADAASLYIEITNRIDRKKVK